MVKQNFKETCLLVTILFPVVESEGETTDS